jgi:HEPN domain-containing protein
MRPEVMEEVRETAHDLTAAPPLLRGAVFHSQQAAEKALKAFLAAHERPLRRTHDLDELGTAVVGIDAALAPAVDRARDLTPYAWRFRYPGTRLDPAEAEAHEALAVARHLFDAIIARLPEAARP